MKEDFEHFMAYSGITEEHPCIDLIRRAYYHSRGMNTPGDEDWGVY